jgi:hypothetical protein
MSRDASAACGLSRRVSRATAAPAGRRAVRWVRWSRAGWLSAELPRPVDFGIALVVLLLLSAPALFTKSGFIDDWVNHLWLTWMQSREIRATGHPSLFVNAEPLGVFYPNFAFYGGTLYGIGGYLMVLTGAPTAVFVGMLVLAFVAAYGGIFWIARQSGVRGLAAHLPATIVVTGAYYLSIAYGRGSWPELLATSAIPVVIAAALRIVRRGASPGVILLLAIATVIWSGSHNLSFLWGAIFIAAVAVALLAGWITELDRVKLRRIGVALGVMLLGVMINAWFLGPDLAYSLHTQIAQFRAIDPAISSTFSRLGIVFNPFRVRATHSAYLRSHFTELPVLVLAWAIVAAVLLWKPSWMRAQRRVVIVLALVVAGLILLLTDEAIWNDLPSTLSVIQFTFRLETYIVMGLAGVTIVVLRVMRDRAADGRSAVLGAALVVIVLIGLGFGVWQVWNSSAFYFPSSPHYLADRSAVLNYRHQVPPTWYETGQLRDVSEPVVPTDGEVRLNVAKIKGERTSQSVSIPAGSGALASNIAASQHLVSVRGLRVIGRTADGFLAFERPPLGRRTVQLTVSRANSVPMRFGPIVTLLGAIGLVLALAASIAASRRRRSPTGSPA